MGWAYRTTERAHGGECVTRCRNERRDEYVSSYRQKKIKPLASLQSDLRLLFLLSVTEEVVDDAHKTKTIHKGQHCTLPHPHNPNHRHSNTQQ